MSTKSEEMARGAQVIARHRRQDDLARLNAAGKVAISLQPLAPAPAISGYTAVFIVDGVAVCSEHTKDPEYPSDRVMATINLAIAATVGFDNIPPVTPTHRVSPEAKGYNRGMRERIPRDE